MKTFYVKTFPKIWQSERFMSMSFRGMLLTKYLYECPHGNFIGFFLIDDHYILSDLNAYRKRWTPDQVRSALQESEENSWISFDRRSRTVLLLNWFEVNPIQNVNMGKAAAKQVSHLPSKSSLHKPFRRLVEACAEGSEGSYEPLLQVFERYPERYGEGSDEQ